jgi:hypothetical protein
MKLSLRLAVCGIAILCAFCMLNVGAFAQDKNTAEISGSIGLMHANAFGEGAKGQTGIAFGGGGGYFVMDNLMMQGEIGISYTSSNGNGTTGVSFSFGPEYVFPVKNDKLKPFVRGDIVIAHAAQITKPGFGFGGGLRYQAGSNWGLRPEFRFVKPVDMAAYITFGVGIYYSFGK